MGFYCPDDRAVVHNGLTRGVDPGQEGKGAISPKKKVGQEYLFAPQSTKMYRFACIISKNFHTT